MPTYSERLETAVTQAEADSDKLHDIVHGPSSGAGSTVSTEGGTVKSAAKVIADAETALAAAVSSLETSAGTSATAAAASASAAATSASSASTYATNAQSSANAASTSATNASTSATLASQWATRTDAAVTTGQYSAKEWAVGTQTRGAANGGSAKDWATYTGGTVDNSEHSAKYYAQSISGQATAAAASATAAASSASNAQTYASNAQTSASAAATSATNAATSASAAATSAAQAAAIAAGLNYKTTVAGASVPATSTAAGDCYLISSAGTSQTVTWAEGDLAIYRGTSGNWDKIPATVVFGIAAALRNGLAPRQGLVGDGSVAPGRVTLPAFGTAGFTLSAWIRPDTLPAGGSAIFDADAGCLIDIPAPGNGVLRVYDRAASATLYSTAAGTIVAGKWYHICYARGRLYINGVDVSGAISDTSDYVNGIAYIGSSYGGTDPVVGAIVPAIYNRALSAAEVVALYESGAPAAADYNSASNTSLITGDNSTFASDTGAWNKVGGATISGGTLNLAASGGASYAQMSILTIGKRYRAVFNVTAITGSLIYGATQYGESDSTNTTGIKTFEFYARGVSFDLLVNDGHSATIDDVAVYPIGLLCAPESNAPGNGLVWNDQSGNGAHIVLPTSGVAWALPSNGVNHIRGTTNTNGNQQLLAAGTLIRGNSKLLNVYARARSGTPTITIGTASGGAQIVASVALSTTWKPLTIALTDGIVTADDDIWIGSNSTDVVETCISHEPLSF